MTSNVTFFSKGGKKVAVMSGKSSGLPSGKFRPEKIEYE